MANRNGLGPDNQGPRTGRGAGTCPPTGVPDSNTSIPRVIPTRIGRGRGGTGRGVSRRPNR